MGSRIRASSGSESIRGSFFNTNPHNSRTNSGISNTNSVRTNSVRTNSANSVRTNSANSVRTNSANSVRTSRKNRSSSKKNELPILDFSPENEAQIIELKSVLKTADALRRNKDVTNIEKIFDRENMENVKKQQESINERSKILLRQRQLLELYNKTANLYNEQKDIIKDIEPRFFNNSKLRKHEKLRNDYHKQAIYLDGQLTTLEKKIRSEKIIPSELLKDIGLLNKRVKALNEDENNPKRKYYDDKYFTRKYKKSLRRGGSRHTRRKR